MLANFPFPLAGIFDEGGRKFTLSEPFVFLDPSNGFYVAVPAGFQTDWNSVPGALWTYFAPWEYPEAGLVHDWLYAHPDGFESASQKAPLTKAQCDDVHRRILHLKGCRFTKRQVIWTALRLFGGPSWEAYRAHDHKI